MLAALLRHLSYANVTATAALFVALGGTSYALITVGSRDVVNNSLRSADLRNNSIRGMDVRDRGLRARELERNSLGGGVIKESSLGAVPRAREADRLGGATQDDLRVRCPVDTLAKAGVCIEDAPRPASGFFAATSVCDSVGRGLPSMAQLERLAVSRPLSPTGEWTSNVYRNPDNGVDAFDQLETVILTGGGVAGFERVNFPVQHAFRCVALPSN